LLGDDVAKGKATLSYKFRFHTQFRTKQTILQSYLGVIDDSDGDGAVEYDNQNLVQTYTVIETDRTRARRERPAPDRARHGRRCRRTTRASRRRSTTKATTATIRRRAASLREDALDLTRATTSPSSTAASERSPASATTGSTPTSTPIFDLLQLRSGQSRFDSQGGFNVHTIVLEIPVERLGGDMQSRRRLRDHEPEADSACCATSEEHRQRQGDRAVGADRAAGQPLFNEGLVAIADKDLYGRTKPTRDSELFAKYAEEPELAALINATVFGGDKMAVETDRTISPGSSFPTSSRSTCPRRRRAVQAAARAMRAMRADDGFSRMSIFLNDVLQSQVQLGLFGTGAIPADGRTAGVSATTSSTSRSSAILSDLRDPANLVINAADGIDNVNANDIGYNKVFPYAATPLNGRNHGHH
jgi:hypothetical protein